jgi:hypothetical protein
VSIGRRGMQARWTYTMKRPVLLYACMLLSVAALHCARGSTTLARLDVVVLSAWGGRPLWMVRW